jgi:Flp pilus assembly pilin Flp
LQTLNELVTEALVRLTTRRDDEQGQTLVEYGLIVAFVAIVSVVIVTTIGTKVPAFFTVAASKLHS